MWWEVQKTGGGRFRLHRLLALRMTNFFSDLEFRLPIQYANNASYLNWIRELDS
jgi:hypothetical protein